MGFQKVNISANTPRITRKWLEDKDMQVVQRPAKSHGQNILEHHWDVKPQKYKLTYRSIS